MVVLDMTLIFDGDCRFCSSSARVFLHLTKQRIATTPYQLANLEALGTNLSACEQAVQYWDGARSYSGHLAIAQALIDSKTSWRSIGQLLKLPLISPLAALAYNWVAKNRHKLPGGTPACSLEGR